MLTICFTAENGFQSPAFSLCKMKYQYTLEKMDNFIAIVLANRL